MYFSFMEKWCYLNMDDNTRFVNTKQVIDKLISKNFVFNAENPCKQDDFSRTFIPARMQKDNFTIMALR